MITEDAIKKEFIRKIISRDASFIYDTQARVLRENFRDPRTANLAAYLSAHHFYVSGSGLHLTYKFNILTYLRLLDIKFSRQDMGSRRRLALYNRVVWGRLYHETIGDLRYGLTEDIKKDISKSLSQHQK
jgi:hypothetical protein